MIETAEIQRTITGVGSWDRDNAGVAADFNSARELIATAVRHSVGEVIPAQYANQSVYAFALVVTEDFDDILFFASTREMLGERMNDLESYGSSELAKWYYANFDDNDVTPLAIGPANDALGECAGSDDIELQARYLWACTKALGDTVSAGLWSKDAAVFCSMADSDHAAWLERESARHINSTEVFSDFEPEQRAAAEEWYGRTEGVSELEQRFAALLPQDQV